MTDEYESYDDLDPEDFDPEDDEGDGTHPYEYVLDADGNPQKGDDGETYYVRDSEGNYALHDPWTGAFYEAPDLDAAAANAVDSLLADYPGAINILAEDAQIELEREGKTHAAPAEPSADQTYTPKTSRDDSLSEQLDVGLDEVLGGT